MLVRDAQRYEQMLNFLSLSEGDTSFFTARLSIVVQKMHRRHDIATGLWHALVEHP